VTSSIIGHLDLTVGVPGVGIQMLSSRVKRFTGLIASRSVPQTVASEELHLRRLYFTLWRQHVTGVRRASEIADRIPLRSVTVAESLSQWRSAAIRSREQKRALDRAVSELTQRRIRRAFEVWRHDVLDARVKSVQQVRQRLNCSGCYVLK